MTQPEPENPKAVRFPRTGLAPGAQILLRQVGSTHVRAVLQVSGYHVCSFLAGDVPTAKSAAYDEARSIGVTGEIEIFSLIAVVPAEKKDDP